ncbi:MAG TPA: hypothetical protein VLX28_14595, partial [Thermoanaerobaculia bacterium]|nr:hypothetical protein [Thermoanaerobaculia bacterium]
PGAKPISMAQFALEASQPQGRQKLPRSVKKEWEPPPPEEGKVKPQFNRDLIRPEPPFRTTGHKRGGFTAAQSKEIIGREHPGSIPSAQARTIETISSAGKEPMGTQRMGMSLNHTLSDSRIKDLYLQAVKNYKGEPAQDEAMKNFSHALTGGDQARVDAAMADWDALKGQPKTNAAKVHRAAEAISNTPTNVRPGPARPNTAISSSFDPEIRRQGPFGVETAETEKIRTATLRLADAGLVSRDSAFDAVTPARSRHDPNLRASSTANANHPERPGFLFERPSSPISTGTKRAHEDDGWNSAPESYAKENAGLERPRKKPRL